MKLENKFRDTIRKYGLLRKKDKVILGVSGGPDSIFMLHQFLSIKKDYKLQLLCAHFNHGLRDEADGEERFIKDVCGRLNIKFISEKKNVANFFEGDSLEQTARNLRFDFFLKCSREAKVKKVALAHHLDDLVETILMRLIRGSGLKGLRGFLSKSKFKSLCLVRPLIEIRKNDIIQWLESNKISYCVDKSNFDHGFLRNRIRAKLMPLLEELNPNISDNLYNLSNNISLDYDFIYSFSYKEFLALKRKESPHALHLDLRGLKGLHLAMFNNVIRIAIEEVKGDTRRLESRHLVELRDLVVHRPVGSVVDLPAISAKKGEKTLAIQFLIL